MLVFKVLKVIDFITVGNGECGKWQVTLYCEVPDSRVLMPYLSPYDCKDEGLRF